MSLAAQHIALAGIDGSGKTTQAQLLVGRLNAAGWSAKLDTSKDDFALDVLRATIGSGDWGRIREVVGHPTMDLLGALQWARRRTSAAAMTAAGVSVVSDRSDLCRVVLAMSAGRCLPAHVQRALSFGGRPDLTVWLDISPAEAVSRIRSRGLDTEQPAQLAAMREAYEQLSAETSLLRVDGAGDDTDVATRVWKAVTVGRS